MDSEQLRRLLRKEFEFQQRDMNTRDSVFDEMSEESKLLYKFDAGYHGGRINLLKELLVAEIEKELLEELV